jgi:polysaccharide biosynthesis/export protein
MIRKHTMIIAISAFLAGCASTAPSASLPRGAQAYSEFPTSSVAGRSEDYRIGALDTLDVTVFQEDNLSAKGIAVDASGNVALPLIGSMAAAGKTAGQLSAEIERRLGKDILVNPQVTVLVASSASQKMTVQGAVTEPGVFEIKGGTTLLDAIAMAKGETEVAALKQVVVFRTIEGKRFGAVFDVASIRRGLAKDPEIRANDVVVVGLSHAKSMWRDILRTAPVLNIFRPLGY